jgi:ubiquinone/menaquinone biosynthesis C-methylase UbiE
LAQESHEYAFFLLSRSGNNSIFFEQEVIGMSIETDTTMGSEQNQTAERLPKAGVLFRTESLTIVNKLGKRISAYLDVPLNNAECLGVVIVSPAYGETKENNLLVSAYFAANRYRGLRFDWTDHVGESDGEIFASTLSKMKLDLTTLVDYVERQYPGLKIGIAATSLAARVALKIVAGDPRPNFLVCFSPVVDLQGTLTTVYREDLVGSVRRGKRYGTLNILGFSIDADNFLKDSIEEGFSDISSARIDAGRIKTPAFFVVGQRDSWVCTADARAIFNTINSEAKELTVLPIMLHRILENPTTAKGALHATVRSVMKSLTDGGSESIEILHPSETGISTREIEEKEHLRDLYVYTKSEERHFWQEYLGNFKFIINVHDFYNLLESIYNHLGEAWSGQKILDAGCGGGNYGLFLLTKQFYRAQQDLQYLRMHPIHYFGIDFVTSAVIESNLRMNQLADQFRDKIWGTRTKVNLVESNFVLGDLDVGIPFPNEFFDQVCCNLVLSYLQKPKKALRELWRVMRPGGKIVITSLKPSADLSEIYRNFISVAESARELEEGRKLLTNAGMIKIKEVRGLYHFYTEKELREAVREAGFFRARTFRSFGDQANIIVCSKI